MQNETIKTALIQKLLPGPQFIPDIVEELSELLNVTPQGVYKALRALRQAEVVSVHNKHASLSLIWISKEKEKMIFAENAYRSVPYIEELLKGSKKHNSWTFHTLNELDLFWTHTYTLCMEQVDVKIPTYSIQPHDWYSYVRTETDSYWVEKHCESGRLSRTLLTHSGELDRVVMRMRKQSLGSLFEYTLNENPLKQKNTVYYNIIGPYLFTVIFDVKVADMLEEFISCYSTLPLTKDGQEKINAIVREKGNFKLTISYSEKKTSEMEKKVKKYFEFS
jgi:DNA-binding transcriptional regulator YhcF (GntR family)